MKTKFYYQPSLELERILVRFYYLATNLYQEQGFLVLPYRLTNNSKSVYLPKIKNFQPTKFLKELKAIKPQIPLEKTKDIVKLLEILKTSGFKAEKLDHKKLKKIENRWNQISLQFEDYFLEMFPQYRQCKLNLEVYWTHYGTNVSFDWPKVVGKKVAIKIYLRDDMGEAQIAEGFISSFFKKILEQDSKYSWLQREAVIDFLLQETKFARLFPDYQATLTPRKNIKITQKHTLASLEYLKQLGFGVRSGLSIKKEKILIDEKMPRPSFSPTEEAILKRLILTPNEAVSYFDLGDLVWQNDIDKFSLWALSRMIFKIRNKLRKNGLSPDHIKNLRGQGYFYTSQP